MPRGKWKQKKAAAAAERQNSADFVESFPGFQQLFSKDPIKLKILGHFKLRELARLRRVSKTFQFVVEAHLKRVKTLEVERRGCHQEVWLDWAKIFCPNIERFEHFHWPEFLSGFNHLKSIKLDMRSSKGHPQHPTDDEKINPVLRREIWKVLDPNLESLEDFAIKGLIPGVFRQFFFKAVPQNITVLDLSLAFMSLKVFARWFGPGSELPIHRLRKLSLPGLMKNDVDGKKAGKSVSSSYWRGEVAEFLKKAAPLEEIFVSTSYAVVFDWNNAFSELARLEAVSISHHVDTVPRSKDPPSLPQEAGENIARFFETSGPRIKRLFIGLSPNEWFRCNWQGMLLVGPTVPLSDLKMDILNHTRNLRQLEMDFSDVLAGLKLVELPNLEVLKTTSLARCIKTGIDTFFDWLNYSLPSLKEFDCQLWMYYFPTMIQFRVDRKLETLRIFLMEGHISIDAGPQLKTSLKTLEVNTGQRVYNKAPVVRGLDAFRLGCASLQKVFVDDKIMESCSSESARSRCTICPN